MSEDTPPEKDPWPAKRRRMVTEPHITINGYKLTPAQAMTVRVALQNFALDLKEEDPGESDVEKEISKGYLNAILAINILMALPKV